MRARVRTTDHLQVAQLGHSDFVFSADWKLELQGVRPDDIALAAALGASGARITAHLVYELARRAGKYAIGSACIGGGQGIAIVLERIP